MANEVADAFDTAFRDYVTDGVPSSGTNKPVKSEVRAIGPIIDGRLTAIQDLATTGINWLTQTIKVMASSNIATATGLENGDTIDGITLSTGDHVFLQAQTTPSQNGLYTVVASGAASRATFADSAAELAHIGFLVQQGTYEGTQWTLPLAAADITVGSTTLTFAQIGLTEPAPEIADRHSVWIDPTFRKVREIPFTINGRRVDRPGMNNQTWDADFAHVFGIGAWLYDTALTTLMGFSCYFVDEGIVPGDVMSFAADVFCPSGGKVTMGIRFFGDVSDVDYTSGHIGSTEHTGADDIHTFKIENQTVPADSVGVAMYFFDGTPTSAFRLVRMWGVKDSTAGDSPPIFDNPLLVTHEAYYPNEFLQNPGADAVIVPPRFFGIPARQYSIYQDALRSGAEPRLWDLGGGSQMGRQSATGFETAWASAGDGSFTVGLHHPQTLVELSRPGGAYNVTAANTPAGAARRVCVIGDSTTVASTVTPAETGVLTQQILDVATANANSVQVTFVGTQGPGSGNVHEGYSGARLDQFFDSSVLGASAPNPFYDGSTFDAVFYLSDTSQAAPDIVVWNLGVNDLFGSTTEAGRQTVIDGYISDLDDMIGLTAGAANSWWDADATIKHLICLPTLPSEQEKFGLSYAIGNTAWAHKRSMLKLVHQLIAHYGTAAMETAGIYLVPLYCTLSDDDMQDGVHMNHAGYEKNGDRISDAINVLVSKGLI